MLGFVIIPMPMFVFANPGGPWLSLVFSLVAASAVFAQGSSPDPIFANIPFDKWLESGEPPQIRWTPSVTRAILSVHQRFRTRVAIDVDGNEVAKRRGRGHLVVLTQFTDSDGRAYQTHQAIGLQDLKENPSTVRFVYNQDAFVTPGDYRIALGVFDSATGEHSAIRKTLHVAPLRNDPLPAAWRNLPAVEFITPDDPPDSWFLPNIATRLSLPLETRRPIRIDVLVNVSPSEWPVARRIGRAASLNVGTLLPPLKVLSQIEVRDGSLNVALLDVTHRSVRFEQRVVRKLDWPRLKTALAEENPNVIDVHALETRKLNAQFFVSEIGRRTAASAESPRVLIVLSGPMAFAGGEDLRPIEASKSPNCRIFYVRCHSPISRRGPPPGFGPTSQVGADGSPVFLPRLQNRRADSLVRMLKPLEPRVFDVDTPEQFRKTLGIMLSEISAR